MKIFTEVDAARSEIWSSGKTSTIRASADNFRLFILAVELKFCGHVTLWEVGALRPDQEARFIES